MSEKKNFVLRLDAKMYAALEKWASDEFRSVNGQLEWMISQQLKAAKRLPGENVSTGNISSDEVQSNGEE